MRKSRFAVSVCSIVVLLFLLVAPLTASAEPLHSAGGSGCAQFHRVQWGETLFRIALRYGTSIYSLQALNGISNPNRIYAGQWLCVRGGVPVPSGFWYTVRWGDTLFSIGLHFGWSAWHLASINHLSNPNYIYAGQRLWIPYH